MRINANDQLDLKSSCLSGCSTNDTLTFTYNLNMLDSNTNKWILFPANALKYYYLTGRTLSDLTIKKQLFSDYSTQNIWKIDLILNVKDPFQNQTQNATSSLNVYVNQPPTSGTCDIDPKNGTTNTLFRINCINWIDIDGSVPVNYVFYGKKFNS